MAALAIDGCSRVLIDLLPDMACPAIRGLVNPYQGESSRRVQVDNIPVVFPVFWRMALIAVGPELSPMYIRVAVRAGRSDHGKFQILVAASAIDMGVFANQWKSRFIMVEIDRLRYGGP